MESRQTASRRSLPSWRHNWQRCLPRPKLRSPLHAWPRRRNVPGTRQSLSPEEVDAAPRVYGKGRPSATTLTKSASLPQSGAVRDLIR